jgi:uncharacterized membrane protein YphA (DoxX/SURF4 family)
MVKLIMIKTVGRLLLTSVCIYGGWSVFQHPDHVAKMLDAKGLPASRQLVILNGVVQMISGSALAVGVFPKLSATALIGSMTATTAIGHAFWEIDDEAVRRNQLIHFFKNLSTMGGLLLVLADKEK